MSLFVDLVLITCSTSVLSAFWGSYLVMRRNTLTVFGITHSLIFGIAIFSALLGFLNSIWITIAAAASALTLVSLVELLPKFRYIRTESALALSYTVFVAGGLLIFNSNLISNAVFSRSFIIQGNISLTLLSRQEWGGRDLGPSLFWVNAVLLTISVLLFALFQKEMRLCLFSPDYAQLLGVHPTKIHLVAMFMISLAATIAFRIGGIVTTVGLIVLPAATARQYAKSFSQLFGLTAILATIGSITGVVLAWQIPQVEPGNVIVLAHAIIFIIAWRYSNLTSPEVTT